MRLSMRVRAPGFALVAVLIATLALPATAEDIVEVFAEGGPDQAADVAAQTDVWFVELQSAPTADGTSPGTVRSEKDAFRREARRLGISYTERFAYDTLFNGLSITVDPAYLSTLSRMKEVRALWPVVASTVPPVGADEGADLATAVKQTGADLAQAAGWTGTGVKVAIMDTGVDYHHPDLGGCFGSGCRVATGYDFVGDAYTGGTANIKPDPDPDDCNGHGTHVAGIVGANGAVRGVAPGVTFGAYRVFGCDGSTTADIMVAAMERALADGMHILNMSIGSALQTWPNYPTAAASDRAVNKGMVVVASIGNSGANGVYSAGAPGVGEKVIGVASFDNTHIRLPVFTITPDDLQVGWSQATGAPAAPTSGSFSMARTGTRTSTADACSPLPAGSLSGKVALIRRGTCTFNAKSFNAQNAGAAAVVIYNNLAGLQNITVAGPPAITIPVVSISGTQGNLIDSRLAAGPVTMTWTSGSGTFVNPTGNLISAFSSYGLAADLSLKPDIGAPGGLIRSTYPLERGAYATISGTSMSSPHVAGAAALLRQARAGLPAQAFRDVLQNSADPKSWQGNPGLGFLDQVHRQGAGMVDIDDAIASTTTVTPGKLSLGEGKAPVTRTISIENDSAGDVTYVLGHVRALSTGGNTNTPGAFTSNASVAFSVDGIPINGVTVLANTTAAVDVTITPTTATNHQYGGYLTLTDAASGAVYRVPYAGFSGDYQSITVITPTACPVALPAIGERAATPAPFCGSTSPVPFRLPAADLTFTLAGGDVPYLVFHLDHQVREVKVEVFDAVTGTPWHRAADIGYVGRNSANGFFWITWDGETRSGNKTYSVPDGRYVLKLTVQKALGDDDDPAHSESWTSPVITIDRP